jgi:hypothetical protein
MARSDEQYCAEQVVLHKSMYEQVQPQYEQVARQWESFSNRDVSWIEKSDVIRRAHALASQLTDVMFSIAMYSAERERYRGFFGGSRAAAEVASRFQPEIDKMKAVVEKWKALAAENEVTLCREDVLDEIPVLADAVLLDAHLQRGKRLTAKESQQLIDTTLAQYSIPKDHFEKWCKATGN